MEKLPGKHDVYNLATSSGTFFANGVLVSNCDALRYMIFSVERGYGAVPGSMTHNGHEKRRGVQLRQGGDGVARGSNGNGNGHGNGSGRLGAGFFNKG
ncbi:MAG: hypothetical protein GY832_01430 [Chloroflexi bacterium]|nr:hypothetical protein [Chloroflexota bacterium]